MIHFKKRFLLPVVLSGALISLSSFIEYNQSPAEKKELLTNGPWKMTFLSIGSFAGAVDECNADDVYHFAADGKYTIDSGDNKCEPDEQQITTGTWQFKNNGAITVSAKGETVDMEILELTSTSLKLKYTLPVVGTIEEVYVH